MCRHPAIHHKWLYSEMRRHIERKHETPFVDFVVKQKNTFPQGFGEFNTLGAFAFKEHGHSYHFIDREFSGEKNDPPAKVTQLWSYTGARSGHNLEMINKILS